MRNLKRVLSLALAAIMLIGMMAIGASAASVNDFPDADEIDDYAKEAVAITTGLGIFSGEAGTGNFNPNGTVNRAQLATIICKILVLDGTVNYDLLKGSSSFPDARTFESGWAEGYINYCHSSKIVRGYTNGTFGAADDVVTWHAALALERAIGYYRDPDAHGESLNETVVTSKGIEIGLYGDMSLGVDHVLTRQELAVMIYNALFAQRVEYSADRKGYVKANDYTVVPNNSTNDPYNTLAYGTFYLVAQDGVVMRNSATDPTLTSTDKVGASTMVDMYDDNRELTGVERSFEYETGTDLIGHAVTVYYSVAHKVKNTTIPEKVYAMVDQATVCGVINYATLSNGIMDYTTMNRAAVDLGFKNRTLGADVEKYNINYALDTLVEDTIFAANKTYPVRDGDYIVLISNKNNKEVEYAIVLKQFADTIDIDTNRYDENSYSISTLSIKKDNFFMEDVLADEDKIIVTPNYFNAAGDPTYAVVQKADTLPGDITEIGGKSISTVSYKTVTADGKDYTEAPTLTPSKVGTRFQEISQLGETTLVLDKFGQLIAISQSYAPPTSELVYVAQFGYKYGITTGLKDNIILVAEIWHADNTSEVITVNTEGRIVEVTDASGKEPDESGYVQTFGFVDNKTSEAILTELVTGALDLNKAIDIEANYENLNAAGAEPQDANHIAHDNGGTYLGVWSIANAGNGTYSLKQPTGFNAADYTQSTYTLSANKTQTNASNINIAANVYIVKGHSTFLPNGSFNQSATQTGWTNAYGAVDDMLKQTNNTIYWFVDGNYGQPGFSVRAIKGVADVDNVVLQDEPGSTNGTWAEEAWVYSSKSVKNTVSAMVIHGATAIDDLGVCYYNQGTYVLGTRGNKYTVTFPAYDVNGNRQNFVYEFNTPGEARDAAEGRGILVNPLKILEVTSVDEAANKVVSDSTAIPSGYYTFYSNKIVAVSGGTNLYAVDWVGYGTVGNAPDAYPTIYSGREVLNGDAYKGTVYVANGTVSGFQTQMVTTGTSYNLFTQASGQAILITNAKVIDLKDTRAGYTSVASLIKDVDRKIIDNVRVSYSYTRGSYESSVLYVIGYDYVNDTDIPGGGSVVTGAYGDAVVPTPDTPGEVTVRYHSSDLTAYGNSLKNYVEAVLGKYAGMSCSYNAASATAKFADGTEATVILQQMYKITVRVPSADGKSYKDYETYMDKSGDVTNLASGQSNQTAIATGASGQYVEQGVPSTGWSATAGYLTSMTGTFDHDMILVPGVPVSWTANTVESVTLGGKDVTSTHYVDKDATIVVTGKVTTASDSEPSWKYVALVYNTDKYVGATNSATANSYEVKADDAITLETTPEVQAYLVKTPDGQTVIAPDGAEIEFSSKAATTDVLPLDAAGDVAASINGTVAAGSTATKLKYTVDAADVAADDVITLTEAYTISISDGVGTVKTGSFANATSLSDGDPVAKSNATLYVTGTLKTADNAYVGLVVTAADGTKTFYPRTAHASNAQQYTIPVSSSVTLTEVAMYKVSGLGADLIRPVGEKVPFTPPTGVTAAASIGVETATGAKTTTGVTLNYGAGNQYYTVATTDVIGTTGEIKLARIYSLGTQTGVKFYNVDENGDKTGSAIAVAKAGVTVIVEADNPNTNVRPKTGVTLTGWTVTDCAAATGKGTAKFTVDKDLATGDIVTAAANL